MKEISETNNQYDFDLMLSSEDFKKNRERNLNLTKKVVKKVKIKKWVKNVLWMLLGALIGISIYQIFTLTTITTTPTGSYSCRGGIIKICTGSDKIANYLGV